MPGHRHRQRPKSARVINQTEGQMFLDRQIDNLRGTLKNEVYINAAEMVRYQAGFMLMAINKRCLNDGDSGFGLVPEDILEATGAKVIYERMLMAEAKASFFTVYRDVTRTRAYAREAREGSPVD